jgi:hypothetical protein
LKVTRGFLKAFLAMRCREAQPARERARVARRRRRERFLGFMVMSLEADGPC